MSRRGLTLLEVLAATVLLAILAGACVPVLQRALPALRPPQRQFELLDLARVADSVVAEPSAFGVDAVFEANELRMGWPDHTDRPAITVRLLAADDSDDEHGWLVFSSGGWTVHRWMELDIDRREAGR
jgi:prepilin-type N-terminal cleavage/methylation domain-containing protein